jgi:tellurite resistance protein TehA-like permease
VYSLATLKLASILNLTFFSVFGTALVILLAAMWLIVGKRTLQGAWRGELFVSPCIAGLKK